MFVHRDYSDSSEEAQVFLRDAGFAILSAETENDFCVIVARKGLR